MTRTEFLHALEIILKTPKGSLRGEETLAELATWDSLAVISFLALADREMDVGFPPHELDNCKTPNDLYAAVIKMNSLS
jgi:acyl carrier protein